MAYIPVEAQGEMTLTTSAAAITTNGAIPTPWFDTRGWGPCPVWT
jgi:hypothetical protein